MPHKKNQFHLTIRDRNYWRAQLVVGGNTADGRQQGSLHSGPVLEYGHRQQLHHSDCIFCGWCGWHCLSRFDRHAPFAREERVRSGEVKKLGMADVKQLGLLMPVKDTFGRIDYPEHK